MSRWMVVAGAAVSLCTALACGGKVTFVTGSSGSGGDGGGGSSGTLSSGTAMTTGSGGAKCLDEIEGGGPLGPLTITGSICFEWPEGKLCPETVVAGTHIAPEPCYLLESVDEQCNVNADDECCYNITETLYCK